MKNAVRAIVGGAALVAAGLTNAAHIIDNFDGNGGAGPISQSSSGVDVTNGAGLASAGMAAGFARDLTTTSSGAMTDSAINSGANLGQLAHSQGAGITGTTTVSYAAGGVDLSTPGTGEIFNAFRLTLTGVDLNGLIGVAVNGTRVDVTTNAILLGNGLALPATFDILFSDFGGATAAANTIDLIIDGSNQDALDATVDSFGFACTDLVRTDGSAGNDNQALCAPPVSVPEPAGLALLGLGLAGFALRRRKV